MKVFYSDPYDLKLPENHRFPMEKYRLLRETLMSKGIVSADQMQLAPLASYKDITRVHSEEYYHAIEFGTLENRAQKKIGFPWSEMMLKRSRASVGGFLSAVEYALEKGFAGNLSGGTHHSFKEHGEGFCVFNDFAIAAMKLIEEKSFNNILILDLDVHQGNGNASILSPIKEAFVVSFHGRKNYPYHKPSSDIDVEFEDNASDDVYLSQLKSTIKDLFIRPWDIVLYQAGVDPLAEDRLGKLALSKEGLFERDSMVFKACAEGGTPIAMGLGGGYAQPIELSIEAHCKTYQAAKQILFK